MKPPAKDNQRLPHSLFKTISRAIMALDNIECL